MDYCIDPIYVFLTAFDLSLEDDNKRIEEQHMIVECPDGIQGMQPHKVKDEVGHLIVEVANHLLLLAKDRNCGVLDLHNI